MSDHYPVAFSLQSSVHPTLEKNISKKLGYMFTDKRFPEIDPQSLLKDVKISKFKVKTDSWSVTIRKIHPFIHRFSNYFLQLHPLTTSSNYLLQLFTRNYFLQLLPPTTSSNYFLKLLPPTTSSNYFLQLPPSTTPSNYFL